MSDNGGTVNPMFAGEGDMSKVKIPCENGPYRHGKGSLYEGGTRVSALANWPGHIKAGSTVDQMIHAVDWYQILVGLAGGQTGKAKPLDVMNVSPTISEGQPSPRTEIVYNVEPFRAAIRQGEWKLIWRTLLPAAVELYNIAQDPSEKSNVAPQNPDKVAAMQQRANELAPAFVAVTRIEPGVTSICATPSASVAAARPTATIDAAATGAPSLRTTTRTCPRGSCANADSTRHTHTDTTIADVRMPRLPACDHSGGQPCDGILVNVGEPGRVVERRDVRRLFP